MFPRMFVIALLAGLFSAAAAGAAPFNLPQVEYSADSTMETEDGIMSQHIYYTPTKERKEMQGDPDDPGSMMVMIIRRDTKTVLQLMPSEKMYMEHKMDRADARDPSTWQYDETVVGNETLNGQNVTKYKTIATSSDGKKYGGFSWRTSQGIPVKVDLIYIEGQHKERMKSELKNIKVGRQDPTLFEVPKDFTKMDMAGMMGGMPGRNGAVPPRPNTPPRPNMPDMNMPAESEDEPSTPPEQDATSDNPSDLKKATDMMKGLFGR